MNKNIILVCDMSFGSTGKGLISGYLAKKYNPDVIVTAWGMNAGHTFIDEDGRKYIHCMLANGVVSKDLKYVLIGPGSSVGLKKLEKEIADCKDLLENVEVLIHPNASVIQQRHIDEESGPMTKIGSTKKGCGAVLIEKIKRNPDSLAVTAGKMKDDIHIDKVRVCSHKEYMKIIDNAHLILAEGSQGYSLGINSGFYPYVTSRECTPAQIMSDSLLPLNKLKKVIGSMRTYPIRVANRYNSEGDMIGWSGPHYDDQHEISFSDIDQSTEYTTVTKLPRRVFTFSKDQCRLAMQSCVPDEVFLNFANYCTTKEMDEIIRVIDIAAKDFNCGGVRYLGNGPKVTDVEDIKNTGE